MKLLKTSKDNKHYHIAYIRYEPMPAPMQMPIPSTSAMSMNDMMMPQSSSLPQMTGITTAAKKHIHDIVNGVVIPFDGHTHMLEEYDTVEIEKKEDDDKIADDVYKLYKEAKETERDSFKKAEISEKFYNGTGQWDKDEADKLKSEKRAALVINELEPKIDLLSGYQRQNRTDFKFLPVEEGDAVISDILNILTKNITEQCDYDQEETKVFEDSSIVGRGLLNLYMDFDKNIQGDIVIERFPWADIYFGPHEKQDLSDCEYLTKFKWYSKSRIKELWPDKADEINKEIDAYMENGSPHITRATGQYEQSENVISNTAPDSDLVDLGRKEFKVIECWRKTYKRNRIIVNAVDDFYFNAAGWKDNDIEAVKALPDFSVIERTTTKMRITKIASKTLLEDDVIDLKNFNIFPVYAKKRGKDWWGKIENAKDMQREVNKRHSQSVDIMNKVASYGWFYDDQTFVNPSDAEKFKSNSSTPGFALKVADVTRPPSKIEGVRFPAEIVQLETMASQKLREMMNINPEIEGLGGAQSSGVAIIERKKQALIGNEFLFDNLNLAKRNLGRAIVALISKHYTPERIQRILEKQNNRQPLIVGGQPYEAISAKIIELLKDANLTKYDVIVSDSPFSASMRQANFAVWLELAKTRPEIPIEFLIDLSDLPDKEKFKALLEEKMAQAQAQEDKKYQTEITKTAMAKDMIPPKGMPQ